MRFAKFSRIVIYVALHALTASAAHAQDAKENAEPTSGALIGKNPVLLEMDHNIRTHDPVIAKEGDAYYVFCTGGRQRQNCIPIFISNDLKDWRRAGSVFEALPDWVESEVPKATNCWAPDISFFNGEYRLYYSLSSFGVNNSAIALATNKTLNPQSADYHWSDQGVVIRSKSGHDDFNAIDPNIVIEDDNNIWIVWGSFWGGIMLRRIDPATGKLSATDATMYNLAARPRTSEHVEPPVEGAIEAPFLIKRGEWWHLFVSHDFCCRGADSNYKVVVGRSRNLTGPYLDKSGIAMTQGGGTLILETTNANWHGAGHPAVYEENGQYYLLFHAYPSSARGSWLRISTIVWEDDWPRVALLP